MPPWSMAKEPTSDMPNCVTMPRAMRSTCCRSPPAPVVTRELPKTICSAARPPRAPAIRAFIVAAEIRLWSSFGVNQVRPLACPRGTSVTLFTGSWYGRSVPTKAWPASWYAMSFLEASSDRARPCRPAMTRSVASLISCRVIAGLLRRAVRMADSFIRFSRSAPLKPAVRWATSFRVISSASFLFLMCTPRICSRPLTSGRPTSTRRSKRPGRRSALSRMSARFVAATTMTPLLPSKPSISVRIWFRVCSRSSLPPPMPAPRWRPMASISSMKMMHGAFSFACLKMSRTRDAPTPTKSSMNSEADDWMKGTPDSPASAFAINVLPVPGGPVSRTPLGILAPTFTKRSGALRKSTISVSSSLASSMPATSSNFTPVSG
mmetsp:Transcript_19865/g.50817  ORF Transcript_19865/g.50817 Transcript_19865/m.50817 type:complete len:378 (-) Transcript_19865:733-1866(-)